VAGGFSLPRIFPPRNIKYPDFDPSDDIPEEDEDDDDNEPEPPEPLATRSNRSASVPFGLGMRRLSGMEDSVHEETIVGSQGFVVANEMSISLEDRICELLYFKPADSSLWLFFLFTFSFVFLFADNAN
jgi:hypothetical protein